MNIKSFIIYILLIISIHDSKAFAASSFTEEQIINSSVIEFSGFDIVLNGLKIESEPIRIPQATQFSFRTYWLSVMPLRNDYAFSFKLWSSNNQIMMRLSEKNATLDVSKWRVGCVQTIDYTVNIPWAADTTEYEILMAALPDSATDESIHLVESDYRRWESPGTILITPNVRAYQPDKALAESKFGYRTVALGRRTALSNNNSVTLTLPRPVMIKGIGLATATNCSQKLSDGVEVAQVMVKDVYGSTHSLPVRLGIETAENWYSESIAHKQPPIYSKHTPGRKGQKSREFYYAAKLTYPQTLMAQSVTLKSTHDKVKWLIGEIVLLFP